MNVGGWWAPTLVEIIDKAREGTYLSRSAFILKTVLEHISESESNKRKEDVGLGVAIGANPQHPPLPTTLDDIVITTPTTKQECDSDHR